MAKDAVAVPVYFPRPLYEWLVVRKARGAGPITEQVVTLCEEGRIRLELEQAAEQITPDPGALQAIQARTRNK